MIRLEFLSKEEISQVHAMTLDILEHTGIHVKNDEARGILAEAGCEIKSEIVSIPSSIIHETLENCPSSFNLYSQDGEKKWVIGDDKVLYNPGSSVPNILDHESGIIRKATSKDLIEAIHITNVLDHIAAQSTSIIPSDIPEIISDFYRLYLVLKHSRKPIITGAFRKQGIADMLELLQSIKPNDEWMNHPTAIFDCCPTSPLTWGDTSTQNLLDCARAGIPAEIVPAPLMGATSPITIAGTLAQSNAEILSGLVIAQLANHGCPVIYGGAPSPLDMIHATPRYGSIESMMTACAAAEIGKHYGLPTHAYLGISDSKAVDAQLGFESALGLILGALTRVNIVSGPGALSFISCHSLEKLVFDNEVCGTAFRLTRGIDFDDFQVIGELIEKVGHKGDFLKQRHTSKKLRGEHFMPLDIIDRLSSEAWLDADAMTAQDRAKRRVNAILAVAPTPDLIPNYQDDLKVTMKGMLAKYNVDFEL